MHRRERKGVWLSSLSERRSVLSQLQQQRNDVLEQLNALLEQQHVAQQQEAQRATAHQELSRLQAVTEQKQKELTKVRQLADEQRKANQAQRITTSSKAAQLATARMSVAPLVLPQELRTHEMAVLHAWLGLLGEQRSKVSQLLEILPLRVEGMRSSPAPNLSPFPPSSPATSTGPITSGFFPSSGTASPSGRLAIGSPAHSQSQVPGLSASQQQQQLQHLPQQQQQQFVAQTVDSITVSLCSLRLPDNLAGLQPHASTKPLCAVLGYALLLLDLASAYMGAPLLHEGSFQGSTSVVWQQQSFWNRRPAGTHCVLPLFIEPGLVAATVAPLSGISNPKSKSVASSSWGSLPLMRAITTPSAQHGLGGPHSSSAASAGSTGVGLEGGSGQLASGAGGGGDMVPQQGESKHEDLRTAFEMLQRSCLCLVRHCAASVSQARGSDPHASHTGASHLPPFSLPGSPPFSVRASGSAAAGSHWPGGLGGGLGAGWPGGPAHGQKPHRISAAGSGLPLPQSWSAWGCLVVLCAALLQDDSEGAPSPCSPAAKLGGVLPAARMTVAAEAAASQAATGAWHHTLHPPHYIPGASHGEDVADDEGWDVVHSVLPPPPSSEDVEQYARALFTDGNTHPQQAGNTSSSFLTSNGQQAVSALTRALSLTSKVAGAAAAASPSLASRTVAGQLASSGQGAGGPAAPAGSGPGSFPGSAPMAAPVSSASHAPVSSSPLSSSMSLLGSLLQGRAASGSAARNMSGTSH